MIAGYECDNQAATCAGLIGVLQGTKCLPPDLVESFNNQYVCFTRDDVQVATPLSEIEERIAAISKRAILDNGGRMELDQGDVLSIAGKTITSEFEGIEYTWEFGEDYEAEVSGGGLDHGTYAEFNQEGERIRVEFGEKKLEGIYDGENLRFTGEVEGDIYDGDIYGEIVYIINCDF